jgi:hypothetical protein
MKDRELQTLADYYDATDTSAEMADAEWDDETAENPMITTSLRLPKNVLDQIRATAAAEGVKPTALMRRWIEERLSGRQPSRAEAKLQAILDAVQHVESKVDRVATAMDKSSSAGTANLRTGSAARPRPWQAKARSALPDAGKGRKSGAAGKPAKRATPNTTHTTRKAMGA